MSLLVKNLEFYNKTGQRQNTKPYDDNVGFWEFEINFDSISTGLFSTDQLHVLEKVKNKETDSFALTSPLTVDEEKIKVKFKKKDYKNFFIYRIDYTSELKSFLVKSVSSSDLSLQTNFEFDSNNTDEFNEISGIKKIDEYFEFILESTVEVETNDELDTTTKSWIDDNIRNVIRTTSKIDAVSVNLGFVSSTHGEQSEVLEIYLEGEESTKIAEITLFCEAESEDSRFTLLLENFGQELSLEDSIVFRESEVLDDKEDNKILNQKRKELLLEYSNIIPYIGSYKGLINALKFYGYGDLKLKEWWLNLTNEKKVSYEINTQTFETLAPKKETFGKNNVMKRTGKFSLFYNIFKLTGSVDEYGIPEIEPNFEYSLDEVLIKLYGLKKLLKEKYLPLNTRIIDITGEGIVFDRVSSTSWGESTNITILNDYKLTADITADPKVSILNNPLQIKQNREPILKVSEIANLTISDLKTLSVQDIEQNHIDVDYETRRGYAKVTLKNNTFKNLISDLDQIFEDIPNISIEMSESYPVYEMQYDIECSEGVGYFKRIIGSPKDLEEVILELDVSGFYIVTVKFYDVYNNVLVQRFPNLFKVELPDPIFGAVWNDSKVYKYIEDFQNVTIDQVTTDFANHRQSDAILEDFSAATLESLDTANYLYQTNITNYDTVEIIKINRDLQYVEIDKNLNIEKLNSQSNLFFIQEIYKSEILPKTIESTNETDSIKIESDIFPDVGDIVEIFEYLNIIMNDLSINKNILTYSNIIEPEPNSRLYIYNNEDVAHLNIKKYFIDRINEETTIEVEDPDGLLALNYTNAFIFKNPRSFEVSEINESLKTLTFISTIDLNIDNIQENLDSGKILKCWWNLTGGDYSIPIREIEKLENSYKVNLIDNNRNLFRITTDYKVIIADYDIEYSSKRLGKTELVLEDLENLDLENEIDTTEWKPSILPGFIINNITSNGSFRIGDSEWFKFSNGCDDDFNIAIANLQNSKIPELKLYDFYLNELDEENKYIHAVSKVYGEEMLSIIEFKGGLNIEPKINPRYACNYPIPVVQKQESNFTDGSINNRMNWHVLLKEWYFHNESFEIEKEKSDPDLFEGGDIIGNFQRHFGYYTNGNLRWYNTNTTDKMVNIKPFTIVGFYADASPIIGKQKYKWTIKNDNTKKTISVSSNKFITFFFTDEGSYSVEVEIEDYNKNKTKLHKSGFVQVKR